MLSKIELSKKYFNDTGVDEVEEFTKTTPEGNIIKGVISKKRNYHLGSMVITEIYWKEKDITFETEQYVQSMPKIYKFKKDLYQKNNETIYNAYEKLDGSCLVFYGIYHNNELIEIIPKTRGVPVAHQNILKILSNIDTVNIKYFFKDFGKNNPVLIFELFGRLNPHEITYPTVNIDINLLGVVLDGEFMGSYTLDFFSKQYDFKMPKKIFTMYYAQEKWVINVKPGFFKHYVGSYGKSLYNKFDTQEECIQYMTRLLDFANENHYKEHNRDFIEGVVLNALNISGDVVYVKIKSTKYLESLQKKAPVSVAKKFIKKEVQKYFDDYGKEAKDLYKKDPAHYQDYITKGLLEDFPENEVFAKKTLRRIERVFLDYLNDLEDEDLVNICEKIVADNPGLTVKDYMRLLASEYPEKKRDASIAFGLFEMSIN